MWVSSCLSWTSSESVVSSTNFWRWQPVDRSSKSTRKASIEWLNKPVESLDPLSDDESLSHSSDDSSDEPSDFDLSLLQLPIPHSFDPSFDFDFDLHPLLDPLSLDPLLLEPLSLDPLSLDSSALETSSVKITRNSISVCKQKLGLHI